jgi:uncharacterized protein YdaU (DUF1376 family)
VERALMAALPYIRLYPADYLADTAHLTAMQHGIYLLLIMNYWQRGGPLPNDDARLAKIAKVSLRDWMRNRDEICDFFTVVESHWRHPRIDAELSHVAAKSLKSKSAAQASVQRRFSERSTSVEPTDTDTEADTEKERKEVVGGRPPSYAFFGKTIRLKPRDFAEWKRLFHTVPDMEAELSVLDGYWQGQSEDKRKGWFHGSKAMLNKRHQENLRARRDYDPDVITV